MHTVRFALCLTGLGKPFQFQDVMWDSSEWQLAFRHRLRSGELGHMCCEVALAGLESQHEGHCPKIGSNFTEDCNY